MIALAILDRKSAQALDRRTKAADQAQAASRKYMESATMPASVMTNDNELTEPSIIGPVTVVPAGYRRVRAVVVRTCREQAIVEFDMPETANTYDLSEELLAAIPPTAWQECTSDPGYAYIDRITDIAGTKGALWDAVTGALGFNETTDEYLTRVRTAFNDLVVRQMEPIDAAAESYKEEAYRRIEDPDTSDADKSALREWVLSLEKAIQFTY